MAHDHFVAEDATFDHTTVDYHRLLVNCGDVTFSSACWVPGGLALAHFSVVAVELKKLISAFSDLSLWVEHIAPSKRVDLVVERDRGMALTTLHRLSASVRNPLPNYLAAKDFGHRDLFASGKVESTNQIHVKANCGQSGAFTRCRNPFWIERLFNVNSEVFTLLHTLNVTLQSPDKFID